MPKWRARWSRAIRAYSGAILTATFVLARDLGWPYLEKLGRQKIMPVQSAADPPKKILLGERAVMADGNDYNLVLVKDQGKPVEVVYPAEGSPLIIVPSGISAARPIQMRQGFSRATSSAPMPSRCWSMSSRIARSTGRSRRRASTSRLPV